MPPSNFTTATATTPLTPTLISTLVDLRVFLSSIPPSSTFYVDLEGKSLSRNGTLSLLTVHTLPSRATGIIDIQTLGHSAFTTPSLTSGDGKTTTLKTILEDPQTTKYFWDVRNDADALWAHHRVRLAGVTDIQLLENASRASDKTYLWGLDKCVQNELLVGAKWQEKERWIRTKREVTASMPNDVFSRRPLDEKVVQYCVNDVVYLPKLHRVYAKRITSKWLAKAMEESARRVVEACGAAYDPQSDKKRFGPWGNGTGKKMLTMDEWLEMYEEEEMEARARYEYGY